MKRYLWVLLFTLIPLSHSFASDLPFGPGERIDYSVSWVKINAGQLSLEIAPMASVKGEKCWHFVMTGRTSGFVDVFYKVRDRIDAYTNLAITHSVFYAKKTRGSKQKDEKIDFFWDRQQARYSKNGCIRKVVKIQAGTFDPLSVFYFFRLKSLVPGQVVRVPVSDGKKCVVGQGKVIRREPIQIGKKTYDCVLIVPDLRHIGGVFRHGKDSRMKMWLTSDALHIPIRIETRVKVGTFRVEMTSFKTGLPIPSISLKLAKTYSPSLDVGPITNTPGQAFIISR